MLNPKRLMAVPNRFKTGAKLELKTRSRFRLGYLI